MLARSILTRSVSEGVSRDTRRVNQGLPSDTHRVNQGQRRGTTLARALGWHGEIVAAVANVPGRDGAMLAALAYAPGWEGCLLSLRPALRAPHCGGPLPVARCPRAAKVLANGDKHVPAHVWPYARTIFSRPERTLRVALRVSTTNGAWCTMKS